MIDTVNRFLRALNVALLVVIAAFLLTRCTPPAKSAADAELCRTAADARLRARAVSVCPGGDFGACPEYDTLMAMYHEDQKLCR